MLTVTLRLRCVFTRIRRNLHMQNKNVFICTFIFIETFEFQTLLVLFFSDLLQRAHAAQIRTAKVISVWDFWDIQVM